MSDALTIEQCEQIVVFVKESERFKKLQIETIKASNPT